MSDREDIEATARQLAQRCGARAVKSGEAISADNAGNFMLVDERSDCPFAGLKFDWTAEEVVEYCVDYLCDSKSVH